MRHSSWHAAEAYQAGNTGRRVDLAPLTARNIDSYKK